MRNITWTLLLLVLIGQWWLTYQINKTSMAIVGAVYLLQSGTSLDQVQMLLAKNNKRDDYKYIPSYAQSTGTFM